MIRGCWRMLVYVTRTCSSYTYTDVYYRMIRGYWCMLTYDTRGYSSNTYTDVYYRMIWGYWRTYASSRYPNVWCRMMPYADVCWRMLTDVFRRMLTYTDISWRMLTYADVCWRMLTYADVCWRMLCRCGPRCRCCFLRVYLRMLTYADVFWRILTYSDVFWRMLTYAEQVCPEIQMLFLTSVPNPPLQFLHKANVRNQEHPNRETFTQLCHRLNVSCLGRWKGPGKFGIQVWESPTIPGCCNNWILMHKKISAHYWSTYSHKSF
jgi:hypothetical protein